MDRLFHLPLYLPAQGASESEATIIEWRVAEGDTFEKGQVLAQVESVKSVFDFESPCAGKVLKLLCRRGETVAYTTPVLEIETADEAMRQWIAPAAGSAPEVHPLGGVAPFDAPDGPRGASILGVGGYLPERVVTNAELLENFPSLSTDYIYQVTGIRERRWANEHEKPSDMAYRAALEAIRKSDIAIKDLDGVIVATTTPDVAMPSTACILQDRLNLGTVPAFDLNAACSGWLYSVAVAQGMIASGMARNILTVGVDMQSRLVDRSDHSTCFIFGDGAGAAVVSARDTGHRVRRVVLGCDARGIHTARREEPGYCIANGHCSFDPWIRIDGPALFRLAVESFSNVIHEAIRQTGWRPEDTPWIIPHQANSRILKAAAKRSGVAFDRFVINLEHMGNTSSASIPLTLVETEPQIASGDKVILCSVGAGITTAAVALEW
jgi:3-oxoacyl-(acyl-carrier-protein) synthase III